MTAVAGSARVTIRLWVVFSLLMALCATASGLFLLHLARPFITALGAPLAGHATMLLFMGAASAGVMAALGGLIVGLRFAGRIRAIVHKAEALTPLWTEPASPRGSDELGALDAALGRLTLSVDRFVRDSDILARLPEGMLLVAPDGGLLSFNAAAETVLGVPLARYRSTAILAADGPLPVHRGNERLARLLEEAMTARDPVHRSELAVATAAGATLSLEVTVQRREWGDRQTALLLLIRDASEKQRIREEIRRADQLAFLGGMAARVAHEIRTPLATVRGLLELLQADIPARDPREAYIQRVLAALDRQDRLVEDLLTLSHPEPSAPQAVSMTELMGDVLGMFPRDPRLAVKAEHLAWLPPVWGDAFRLGEVFANLITNALESTPADGVIEVYGEVRGRERVQVRMRNTGVGIPPELRERIFQPFFTTKVRGTGLGLSIARQIVEAHGGRLDVESDGTSETVFVVELPAAPVPALMAIRRESNA
jgi:PAS domain S-box-containing protein